jgi:hypothetical protein
VRKSEHSRRTGTKAEVDGSRTSTSTPYFSYCTLQDISEAADKGWPSNITDGVLVDEQSSTTVDPGDPVRFTHNRCSLCSPFPYYRDDRKVVVFGIPGGTKRDVIIVGTKPALMLNQQTRGGVVLENVKGKPLDCKTKTFNGNKERLTGYDFGQIGLPKGYFRPNIQLHREE